MKTYKVGGPCEGVRFPASCLSIANDASVLAVDKIENDTSYVALINIVLACPFLKHAVKFEIL